MARGTSSNPTRPRFFFAFARARNPIAARVSSPTSPLPLQRQPRQSRQPSTNTQGGLKEYFYGLVERSIQFRTDDSLPPRFETFTDASSLMDMFIWYLLRIIWMGSMGIVLGCISYSIWVYVFGDATVSNSFGIVMGGMLSFFYIIICLANFTNEVWFFKARIPIIGLLSLDLQILSRSSKTILIFFFNYMKWEEKLGKHVHWASMIVWFASSFSVSAISMLVMYGQEFAHSRSLIDDFINVLIPLCLTQYFIQENVFNAALYLIPILVAAVFGYGPVLFSVISGRAIRFVYRPHGSLEAYVPTIPAKSITDYAR